jgi:signal transduction histidine kinase
VSLLGIIWSMIAAACGMLGLTQAFLWWHNRKLIEYPISMLMAFSAMAIPLLEMNLVFSADAAHHDRLILWMNLAVATVLVSIVWSLRAILPTTRRWAAVLITALWIVGICVNFLLPGNLTFSEVLAVEPYMTPWGEQYFIATGTINPWKWTADITVLLIPLYAIDGVWRARKTSRFWQNRAIVWGIVLFVLIAGTQAILLDMGHYQTPYAISLAFFFVILSFTWVLAQEAVRAGKLDEQIAQNLREMEQSMRINMMGEVAATLAHEINQPLSAILGNAQAAEKFLARQDPDLGEIREIFADIVRDDKRARDIIASLRRMLRGDSSEDQKVDLESVTHEVLAFMERQLAQNAISAQLHAEKNLPRVCGGRVAIQQVLLNLILNAEHAIIEANATQRVIEVRVSEKEGGCEVQVSDSGPGIAEEVRENLFEPFVTTRKSSLGMGLTVCRRIIENQGGRLTLKSQKSGGACFRAWLPACTL